jgi:hypothetical protein
MQLNFNAGQHQARVAGGGNPVIPAGKYPAILGTTEGKPTSKNDGGYMIEATFFVTDGEQRGRKIINRYNIQNQNPTTVEMAFGELAALSLAVGVPGWSDTNQLCNRPLILDVSLEESGPWRDRQGVERPGGKQNRIVGYYTAQGVDATTLQAGNVAAPAQAPTGPLMPPSAAPPWAAGVQAQVPVAAGVPASAPASMPGYAPAPAAMGAPPPWQQQPQQNGGMVAPPAPVAPPWAQQAPAQAAQPAMGQTPPWATPQG